MKILRNTAIAAVMAGAMIQPAFSADTNLELSEGAQQQLQLSDNLIALGRERKDPILIIAGAHLRNTLTNDSIDGSGDIPSKSDLLAEAKSYANGRADLIGIAEDVDAASSRGCYNWNGGTGAFSCPPDSQFAN